MEIIVRDQRPLVIARVGDVKTDSWKKLTALGFPSASTTNQYLYPEYCAFNISKIEKLVNKINTASSMQTLPDVIQFNYNDLEAGNISLSELASTINFSYKLAAQRLSQKPKHVTLTGRVHSPVSYEFKELLEKNNFAGGIVGVAKSSLNDTREHISIWKKDNGFWDKRAYRDKIIVKADNPFDLTFRQTQILHIIRSRGLTNAQIANMLKISESTVKMHVGLILKKHGFRTRMQLVTNTY